MSKNSKVKIISRVIMSVVVLLSVMATTLVFLPNAAQADELSLTDKALLRGMYSCYGTGWYGIERTFKPADSTFFVADSGATETPIIKKIGQIYLPTNVDNSLNNNPLNCYQVFNGVNGLNGGGLFARFGKNTSTVTPSDMGYIADESNADKYYCFNLDYQVEYGTGLNKNKRSNDICYPADSAGKITEEGLQYAYTKPAPAGSEVGSAAGVDPKGGIELLPCGANLCFKIYKNDGSLYSQSTGTYTPPATQWVWVSNLAGKTTQEIQQEMINSDQTPERKWFRREWSGFYYTDYYYFDITNIALNQDSNILSQTYTINTVTSAKNALKWFTGSDDISDARFKITDDQWAGLYNSYINQLRSEGKISVNTDCNASKDDDYVITYDKGTTWCKVDIKSAGNEMFAGKANAVQFGYLTLMPLTDILNKMKNLNYDDVGGGTVDPPGPGPVTPSGETTEQSICAKTSGVLSWLFCPVLSFVGEAVGGMYEWVKDSFLEVKSSFMDRNSGTYKGWAVFRNLANVLFAIAFIVVILAQITGIGLTNYNIKKILPRLIMVVVLVNLSYILCQLAVDLSNIVGSQLNSTFKGLGSSAFNLGEAKSLVQGLVDGVGDLTGGVLGVAIVGGIAAVTWDLWILPLFLALVGALISIFFFFLILGIRQAGVLIMVALAPLAIVCYALPNTKTIFDKWWKVFSALLLVYPICGALMGGTSFAASLMVENAGDNFLYVLIALLLTIVPFFFIPSILRNSLNGLGMLGTKIGNFSRGMQMRSRGAIMRSDGFQDMQRQMRYGRAARAFRRQSAIRNSRVGQAVAGAAGAISQWSDTQSSNPAARVGKALTRGARAIGRPMAQASQRRFYRNAMSTLQRDRENAAAERLDATLEGENARQFALDVQSEEALYRSPDGGLNVEDPAAVNTEYRRELEAYMRNPQDRQRRARVAALQNILSTTDPGTEYMQSTLTELAMANHGRSRTERELGENAISRATRELNLGAMKAKSDTFAKMLTDFRQGQFGNFYSGGLNTYTRDGNTFSYASAYQDRANYSGASLASADDSARDQLIQGIQSGEMGDRTMANVVSAAEELLAGSENGTIAAKGKDKTYARRILAAAYARGAVAHPTSGPGVPTQGSTAMRNASTDAIARIAAAAREPGSIITNDQIRNMAENARVALEDSGAEYTEEHAAALNDIINAAQERIELDADGNQVVDPGTGAPVHMRDLNGDEFHNVTASSATFRVKGAPQQFTAPSLPTGWVQEQRTTGKGKNKVTRMVWVDTSGVKKRVLSNDEAAYADQIQAIKQNFAVRNAEHGFIPTQPPPPGGGGGGAP